MALKIERQRGIIRNESAKGILPDAADGILVVVIQVDAVAAGDGIRTVRAVAATVIDPKLHSVLVADF